MSHNQPNYKEIKKNNTSNEILANNKRHLLLGLLVCYGGLIQKCKGNCVNTDHTTPPHPKHKIVNTHHSPMTEFCSTPFRTKSYK